MPAVVKLRLGRELDDSHLRRDRMYARLAPMPNRRTRLAAGCCVSGIAWDA